jgi:hypothetical protein
MLRATDREKLQDCLLLIQSARNILTGMPGEVVPGMADIDKCFHDVDLTITRLLRA